MTIMFNIVSHVHEIDQIIYSYYIGVTYYIRPFQADGYCI